MSELNLEIITPEKPIFKGQVDVITIPGTLGGFQILKNHAPLISSFEIGILKVKKDSDETYYTTAGGTVEVNKNKVLVLADSIEKVDKIDKDRAEQARTRAEERLKRKHEADVDEARANAALNRALNRLNAVKKYSS
ncbi:MAG: F0F1 ATP synthase subunit epsilon [Ignavibacteriaceae bacterium]|nr:F0F1 ATP synthase subunit epsilon [Ignavibacteriaceae bacterium]MCW8813961.1 F0F1 ATP synthase subunit epsilon [Chlorobium sp.]MCW8816829.1 F0F1 ATP synthase subunit epsilon [Ignavibacteriaceae bacterium]MCW8822913.1 F0F1 ATP synthase subunit epsilon [Ignavibacteriaceae bacterium]MCW8961273.1 F0F1 ATP synthase subunit epsilon [Ignavibacteriaceae bacterium]